MERITQESVTGAARYGHEFRYRLAAGFICPHDWVLDAACGTGYGFEILRSLHEDEFWYLGVDQEFPDGIEINTSSVRNFNVQKANLINFALLPSWEGYQVFLGFETIEHLSDHDNYVRLAHQAQKWILVSAPVIPHANPYHVRDFVPGELRTIFENEDWEHYQTVQQPSELSEIVILRRRT